MNSQAPDTLVFLPARRIGLVVQLVFALVLAAGVGISFWFGVNQKIGSYLTLLLLLSLLLAVPLAWVLYRGFSLIQARYIVERDGLRIRWGLHNEDIPLPEIEWVRPVGEMGLRLPQPAFAWPGAILGRREIEDLGRVEFLASDLEKILLVATPRQIYAISPEDTRGFQAAFQRAVLMGSLTPFKPRSTIPAVFLKNIWSDRAARTFMISGIGLTLILLVLVNLVIPTLSSAPLGLAPYGQPAETVPPQILLILPLLATFTLAVDLLTGMFFYRRPGQQIIAYLLWASSSLTPLMLIIATLLLL